LFGLSYQLSVNRYQSTVISQQLSVISYQLSVISQQLSVNRYQLSVISQQLSVQGKSEIMLLMLLMLLLQHNYNGDTEGATCRICEKFCKSCKCDNFQSAFYVGVGGEVVPREASHATTSAVFMSVMSSVSSVSGLSVAQFGGSGGGGGSGLPFAVLFAAAKGEAAAAKGSL